MSRRSYRSLRAKVTVIIILAFILISFIFIIPACDNLNRNTYTGMVTDKVIKGGLDKEQKYLIFVELGNGESRVFENSDSVFNWKFNSSDMYARLKIGNSYTFNTVGFRIPVFSAYENIIKSSEPIK
jgi:hypothetical protein